MKGIVFNILEEVVIAHYGERAWDDLLEAVGSRGVYTSLGTYPDQEMMRLVKAASSAFAIPPSGVLRWFGRNAIGRFRERYPEFFAPYTSTRAFVRTLDAIIRPEVLKLYTGAVHPSFTFQEVANDALLIGYRSPRKLCALAHGCIEGAADYYHEHVTIEHLLCMNRGDARCLMRMALH